jgi:ABC-type multidrug transport system fused ATPase/permease subunit
VVVILSLTGGLIEAGVLVLVAHVAARLASDDASRPLTLGPLNIGTQSISAELVVALVLVAMRVGCQLGATWSAASASAAVQIRLRRDALTAFEEASWEVQSVEREGGLAHVIDTEVVRVAIAMLQIGIFLTAACNLVTLVTVAIIVSPVAAGAALAAVAVLFGTLRPLTQRVRRLAGLRSRYEKDVARTVNEAVRTAEEVHVFGVGPAVLARLDREATGVARHTARLQFLATSVTSLYQGAALTLVLGALAVIHITDLARPAALASIMLILLRAFAYSQQAQAAYNGLGENGASVQMIEEQIARYRACRVPDGTAPLATITSLRLDAVSYAYAPGRLALDAVSLEIEPGTTVGVIGPSGAGKSTLVQVLLRLRPPTAGTFEVNGRPAADYRAEDWSRLVSYMPQEPKLITGSVADNVRFNRSGLDDVAVEDACRAARIHDEIVTWARGYDTAIGPGMASLSGGQRQRLCLARALVTRPDLLILDEPTSALDLRSESLVQESLEALGDRTTIVLIAHRLSTLNICDRLLVLDAGRVETSGPAHELAKRAGFYMEALELTRP